MRSRADRCRHRAVDHHLGHLLVAHLLDHLALRRTHQQSGLDGQRVGNARLARIEVAITTGIHAARKTIAAASAPERNNKRRCKRRMSVLKPSKSFLSRYEAAPVSCAVLITLVCVVRFLARLRRTRRPVEQRMRTRTLRHVQRLLDIRLDTEDTEAERGKGKSNDE
jgi:hypothetical protein